MPTAPTERDRRPAAALLLVVLLAPVLTAGCFEDPDPAEEEARLLSIERPPLGDFPTIAPPVNATNSTAPEPPLDPSPDPRLNLSAPWQKGDKWYYESNMSRFLRVTVLGGKHYDGVPHYVVKTESGLVGYPPTSTTVSRVTLDFRTVNTTLDDGFTEYSPSHPALRFLPRYGEYSYNESGYQRVFGKDISWIRNVSVLVQESWPLYPIKVPAGKFLGSHFTIYTKIQNKGESGFSVFVNERWYSPEVRNDVMLKTNSDKKNAEWFQLVYFVRNGEKVGLDIDYEK